MPPEEYVNSLYRICLKRPADPEGFSKAVELIRSTGDHTLVLQSILQSPEFAAQKPPSISETLVDGALAGLRRRLRVVDVGAQSLGMGTHPYSPLDGICAYEVIGFDPLQNRLRERAKAEAGALKLLPYTIGDGGLHTLYVNNDDATSSLFPLNEAHNAKFNHLCELRTVRTEAVATHRLDDVLPDGPVDFLKLDIQGAELMALRGAERVLMRTAVIHCEVAFSPYYCGMPLFAEVEQHLTPRGFILIDLLQNGRYHCLTASGRAASDCLLWADAVFFRETGNLETRRIQSVIAAVIYRKPTLAEYLLSAITA